ncbi:kinesin-domain-containing protein, partial [Martensiomyces pterosporus]
MSSCGHKIKVVCRVRPFLKSERPDESVGVEPNSVLRVTNPRDTTKDIKFNFDACYGAVVGQDTIYKNDVRPLVETIFNGMSATVFCYGVTGAGKTHTIQGTEAEPGIIPRALEHIFMHQQRDAYDYDIRISYYEIYKEAVYDLLRPRDSVTPLPIREDAHRKIFVAGLSEKKVTSYEQFDALYQRACGNRSTASTKLNNHSSRSHAILTVQVQWKDDVGAGKMWCGKLHLIDLAGSEDNRRTENGKDRMAESSAINRSLFVLGQVVEALNTGSSRIPYRDSKMTRILQDSLGGESLGMMIVNVAPGEAFLQDTHNTLNFATKSREVVNKPVAHE